MTDMSTQYQYSILEIEMQRDFKGIWIPKEVWLDGRLSPLDKVILMEIDSLDQTDRGCFAGNKRIAEFCQCSERKVTDSVKKLKAIGYLREESFDGRTRCLKSNLKRDSQNLLSRVAKSAMQGGKKCEADTQKLRHSNINNNTDSNPTTNKRSSSNGYASIIEGFTDNTELQTSLMEFAKMRKMIKRPLTDNALSLIIKKLSKLSADENEQIAIVNQSIEHSWQGIFPLNESNEVGVNGVKLKSNRSNDLDGIL